MAKPFQATKRLGNRRPAESTGGTLSVAVGAAVTLLGLDMSAAQVGAVVALLGLVPAVVTWFKTRG
jgi:hypothetical protein